MDGNQNKLHNLGTGVQCVPRCVFRCVRGWRLSKTQEAIDSGRIPANFIEEGLAIATEHAHSDIVAALSNASAHLAFVEAFLEACVAGALPEIMEAIASGRLTMENLEEGLALATDDAFPDIVGVLLDAGVGMAADAVACIPGQYREERLGVLRQYLDHGLDPNTKLDSGEPLLGRLSNLECTREMLMLGANPNTSGPSGRPPFIMPCTIVPRLWPSCFWLMGPS